MAKILAFPLILLLFFSFTFFSLTEIVGPITQEDILQNVPDWQEVVSSYFPRQEILENLKSIDYEVKIEVFLGTWCPDSKRNVSAYFKIMDLVDNLLLQTSYFGVPRNKESREPYIQGKNIVRIPTFIVFVGDTEKGRIIENPVKSVEEDLWDILNR